MKVLIGSCFCTLSTKALRRLQEATNWNELNSKDRDQWYKEYMSGRYISLYTRFFEKDTLGILDDFYLKNDIGVRTDEAIIRIVEELGLKQASGRGCELSIIELSDNIKFKIDRDKNGSEGIRQVYHNWGSHGTSKFFNWCDNKG